MSKEIRAGMGIGMIDENKYRILYLYNWLVKHTDAEHPMTTAELIRMLKEEYDIEVNRNTITKDLSILKKCNFHIEMVRTPQNNRYYWDGNIFETPEIKLMMDAISPSKFITQKESERLINKLMTFVNSETAEHLKRNVFVTGRVKSSNEKGYYIEDALNDAINDRKKVSFQYMEYDVYKKCRLKNSGQFYILSPYTLIWDGDYYYVIGFCDSHNKIQTFRLDRIARQPVILEEDIVPMPPYFRLAEYYKSVFRMYDTDEPVFVELLCENSMMNAIIDQFGKTVNTRIVNDTHFIVKAEVCASPTFYRWIFGWDGRVKILKPQEIRQKYKKMLSRALEIY